MCDFRVYPFHGRNMAILAHALTKEGEIPEADLERARGRRDAFAHDPERHTYEEDAEDSDG